MLSEPNRTAKSSRRANDPIDTPPRPITSIGQNVRVVFRGVDFGSAAEEKQVADAYVPGTVYEEPAFFSTDVTKPFEGNVQFEVRSTNGRYIHDLSASNLTEEEVLFPPGTRFNVLDKFFDKDTKTWHIGLEDIP